MLELLGRTLKKLILDAEVYDGEDSQLPRLIQLRAQRSKDCGCDRCTDLLSKMHFSGLLRQHIVENIARRFWSFGADNYMSLNAAAQISLDPPEQNHKFITDLINFENEWSAVEIDDCLDRHSDNVWLDQWYQIETQLKKF